MTPQLHNIDLPARIHAASVTTHQTLYQSLLARIPLGLPPNANSPHLYALGISRFARIYFTIENAWRDYLEKIPVDASDDRLRYRALLADAYIPAITRSHQLKSDLSNMKKEWGDIVTEENTPVIQSVVTHISETYEQKPYILLAYSWIMYMALFNGGRWIRGQLLNAGPQFWHEDTSNVEKPDSTSSTIQSTYLSFWYFSGNQDGEDVKGLYKTGFIEASKRLTEAECDDVIRETQILFDYCLKIITEIDATVALQKENESHRCMLRRDSKRLLFVVLMLGIFLAIAVSFYG